jgi:hypothetical protein
MKNLSAQSYIDLHGFSVVIFLAQLLDDFDIFFWCDWIA